ncbi:hypothetical protein C8R48DRAFT_699489 [Suillus tomentosus]|nr:hypothetical protein C8R48DRAFT_699489 [Suillus tomentosus]
MTDVGMNHDERLNRPDVTRLDEVTHMRLRLVIAESPRQSCSPGIPTGRRSGVESRDGRLGRRNGS